MGDSPDLRSWNGTDFESAWKAQAEIEDSAFRLREALRFLADSTLMARWTKNLKTGASEADGLIGLIESGVLERHPEAAVAARAEYGRFLSTLPFPLPPDQAADCMVFFYLGLRDSLSERGIDID